MMRVAMIATSLAASAHAFATTPASACPTDVFGYVSPLTDAVVDVSVGPLVLADGFGFGAVGGDYLYDAEVRMTATPRALPHCRPPCVGDAPPLPLCVCI